MGKLIFFDIDGTLTIKNGALGYVIPESTYVTLKKLQENGHLCFINSGRAKSELDESILNLGMDGIVCGCGTYISYQGEELFHQTIPFPLGNDLLRDLELCRLEWLLEGKDTLYYSETPYTTHIGDFQIEHREEFNFAVDLIPPQSAQNLTFDKFCICLRADSDLQHFRKKYEDRFTFIDRGNDFFEIVPISCSKASGMQFLMDYFHIPREDTFAIGDSTNDLPMLEFAGTSIAMGNSSPQLFELVDYVTTSILEDGIHHAMQHFGLL